MGESLHLSGRPEELHLRAIPEALRLDPSFELFVQERIATCLRVPYMKKDVRTQSDFEMGARGS
jgi:hypothetical protein